MSSPYSRRHPHQKGIINQVPVKIHPVLAKNIVQFSYNPKVIERGFFHQAEFRVNNAFPVIPLSLSYSHMYKVFEPSFQPLAVKMRRRNLFSNQPFFHADIFRFLFDEDGDSTPIGNIVSMPSKMEAIFKPHFEKALAETVNQARHTTRTHYGQMTHEQVMDIVRPHYIHSISLNSIHSLLEVFGFKSKQKAYDMHRKVFEKSHPQAVGFIGNITLNICYEPFFDRYCFYFATKTMSRSFAYDPYRSIFSPANASLNILPPLEFVHAKTKKKKELNPCPSVHSTI